jgi:hypothetical protein
VVPLFDVNDDGDVDENDALEILDMFGPVFLLPNMREEA